MLDEMHESQERARKIRKKYRSELRIKKVSCTEALQMVIDNNLTKSQYQGIRKHTQGLPCYQLVAKEKQKCYPMDPLVTETTAEVELQELLNHTTRRIVETLTVEDYKPLEDDKSLELICKWGCDGSNQVMYKQKFLDDNASDASVFITSIVPLRLQQGELIIWQNPLPSSPRFCRPLKINYAKETFELTNDEIKRVKSEASLLKPTQIDLDEKNFLVHHRLLCTMVDGKVCNAITDTKFTRKCFVCGLTFKDFNNIEKCKKEEVEKKALEFGLSTLHARIRLFESMLKVGYKEKSGLRLETIRKEHKAAYTEAKLAIQAEFRKKLGLRVDMPTQGAGNSNDGNTARRFFDEFEISAEILGIQNEILYRLKVILELLTSQQKFDVKKFEDYCMETAKMYIHEYSYQPMTPTMHKILIHGAIVAEHALVPIGMLSEEASEARNKHFRNYREDHSRKFSRTASNTDVFNRLMLTSDPLHSTNHKVRSTV